MKLDQILSESSSSCDLCLRINYIPNRLQCNTKMLKLTSRVFAKYSGHFSKLVITKKGHTTTFTCIL